ncbi:restriction endonuclease subunit S [Belliella kenyensis]|uniref:Restriction endonuclease subunit S n=1 Tax=Belliella kenyensis TaxID=1472724 RepID=A0ABV8EL79_9BACT|nr:restriction endonuclease subunit S [Belliella kenyensis]MCH7401210.1 restriction endonuclease subunit S [Belliella kenyensis]MDN3602656.1 restriction endonuclease subunit S [Belliella kenyensis]
MKFGLSDIIVEKLQNIFAENAKVDKAIVFGSRAKGNYKEGSDIDIAIKGQDFNFDDTLSLHQKFDDTNIPYKVDLINYHTIKEPELKDHIDRVGIELYSRWKEVKLGEFIETINGYAFKSTDFLDNEKPNSLPVIKIKNVANGDVNIDGVHYHLYSDNLKKYVVEKGDVLISLTGNHPELETQVVGLVSKYKLDTKALLNQRVGKLFSKNPKELSDDYLYYFLKNKDTHHYLASQSSGSANQANISKTDIEKISFSKPPLQEQIAIASILSSLDDKIDLLHRQNKTLEQLAETLFRAWFVEEAEESWETATLGQFVKTNLRSISKDYEFTEIEYLDTSSLTEGIVNETQKLFLKNAPSRAKRLVQNNDILISTVRPDQKHYGIINNPKENLVVSTGFCVITCTDINPYFVYLLLTNDEMTQYLHSIAEGSTSTYPSLKPSDIEKIEFQNPPKSKMEEFGKIAADYWTKINSNQTQIRTLIQTRDTLLPKLMSGEIKVNL